MKTVSVDVKDVTKNLVMSVRIRGLTRFHIRLWLAKQMIYLASKILGCEIRFKGWSDNADIIG